MPSDAPKLVYPLASTDLIFGVLQIPFSIFLAATGQSLGIITACGALILTLRAVRTLSTRMTEVGVSQLTWGGRVTLSWTQVNKIEKRPLSVTLKGNEQRVVIAVEVFDNTSETIAYIESHLPERVSRI